MSSTDPEKNLDLNNWLAADVTRIATRILADIHDAKNRIDRLREKLGALEPGSRESAGDIVGEILAEHSKIISHSTLNQLVQSASTYDQAFPREGKGPERQS